MERTYIVRYRSDPSLPYGDCAAIFTVPTDKSAPVLARFFKDGAVVSNATPTRAQAAVLLHYFYRNAIVRRAGGLRWLGAGARDTTLPRPAAASETCEDRGYACCEGPAAAAPADCLTHHPAE